LPKIRTALSGWRRNWRTLRRLLLNALKVCSLINYLPTVNDLFSASIKNATKSSLSTEGPDAANVIDIRKFETMKAWLDIENVLLLRSPPGSGKTTFALSFAAHLHSNGFKVTYLNASLCPIRTE
jgi:polynucleotide 5'-kinase involved in rRNA processing